MKEYIERAAVHDLVKSLLEYHMFNYDRTESRRGISPDDVDFGVDKIPAADVVEVRHGRWEFIKRHGSTRPYHCSCGVCQSGQIPVLSLLWGVDGRRRDVCC